MNKEVFHTQEWIDEVVIGLGLCPFVVKGKNEPLLVSGDGKRYKDVLNACDFLFSLGEEKVENFHQILIFSACALEFIEFYELSKEIQAAIDESNIALEVVCFHPEFQFDGERTGDLSHYVNRSPYPSLHFISTPLMNKALADRSVDFGEKVSHKNAETMNSFNAVELTEKVLRYTQGFWNR